MHTAQSPSTTEPPNPPTHSASECESVADNVHVERMALAEFRPDADRQPLSPMTETTTVDIRFGSTRIEPDCLNLDAGQLIVLEQDLEAAVELVLAGQVIALGELVTQDGYVGVRIIETRMAEERAK